MKTGKINAELKAKIDGLKKAKDAYTRCLVMEYIGADGKRHPVFDIHEREFLMSRITGLADQTTELVKRI